MSAKRFEFLLSGIVEVRALAGMGSNAIAGSERRVDVKGKKVASDEARELQIRQMEREKKYLMDAAKETVNEIEADKRIETLKQQLQLAVHRKQLHDEQLHHLPGVASSINHDHSEAVFDAVIKQHEALDKKLPTGAKAIAAPTKPKKLTVPPFHRRHHRRRRHSAERSCQKRGASTEWFNALAAIGADRGGTSSVRSRCGQEVCS